MNRRSFLQTAGTAGIATGLAPTAARAYIPEQGYRVFPSFIWSFARDGTPGLVVGLANKGVAGVPGVLRLTVFSDDGKVNMSGCVDPGYPKPTGIRQAMLMLPPGTKWEGLKLKAELEVKGVRYPMNWACQQKTNSDGSLTLRHNVRG